MFSEGKYKIISESITDEGKEGENGITIERESRKIRGNTGILRKDEDKVKTK